MATEKHTGDRWVAFVISMLVFIAYVLLNRLLLGSCVICPFRALTSYPCPGCGLTHAGIALLHLDLKASLKFHALFLPVIVTLFIVFFPRGLFKVMDWAKRQYWWYALLTVALFGYYGFRMIRYYPGEYPMYRNITCYLSKMGIMKPLTLKERADEIEKANQRRRR